jgi:hypothetical protein
MKRLCLILTFLTANLLCVLPASTTDCDRLAGLQYPGTIITHAEMVPSGTFTPPGQRPIGFRWDFESGRYSHVEGQDMNDLASSIGSMFQPSKTSLTARWGRTALRQMSMRLVSCGASEK